MTIYRNTACCGYEISGVSDAKTSTTNGILWYKKVYLEENYNSRDRRSFISLQSKSDILWYKKVYTEEKCITAGIDDRLFHRNQNQI